MGGFVWNMPGKMSKTWKNDGNMWWNMREWGKDAGKCEDMRNMMRTYEGMVDIERTINGGKMLEN